MFSILCLMHLKNHFAIYTRYVIIYITVKRKIIAQSCGLKKIVLVKVLERNKLHFII